MIEISLPWPPSVNHYKKMGGFSRTVDGKLYQRRVNTNQTKQFYFDVWVLAKSLFGAQGSKFHSSDAIVEVALRMWPPHTKRFDIDNFCKVTLDSLVRAKVIKDDSNIHRLVVEKMSMIAGGRIDVKILEFSNAHQRS